MNARKIVKKKRRKSVSALDFMRTFKFRAGMVIQQDHLNRIVFAIRALEREILPRKRRAK